MIESKSEFRQTLIARRKQLAQQNSELTSQIAQLEERLEEFRVRLLTVRGAMGILTEVEAWLGDVHLSDDRTEPRREP